MEKNKGGFPPIKYCPNIIDTSEKKSNNRTRTIASDITRNVNRNVNIKQILNNNIPKLLINISEKKIDDLDIVDTF